MSLGLLRHVHRTISFRLAVWSSLIFMLSSLSLFGFAYFLISSSLEEKDRTTIQLKLKEYASEYQTGGLPAVKTKTELESSSGVLRDFSVRVAGAKNETMFFRAPQGDAVFDFKQLDPSTPQGAEGWSQLKAVGESDVLDVATTRLPGGYFLQVGKDPEQREDVLDSFRNTFAVVFAAVVALGLAGGTLLAFQALRPVRGLINALRPIIETGKVDARVPVRHTGDELDELSVLFNQALDKIEALILGMRASLDNVAHDLRTPMTRLRGVAEMALQAPPELDTYREALADCLEESEQVIVMVNTLMDISEVEAGSVKLDLEEVNILALMNHVVELYRCIAEDKGIIIHTDCPESLSLIGDRNRLSQVMANLLDNAIKYTPTGGTVEIAASCQGEEVVITIQDTGRGIPPDELNRVWDRFYRGDKSRAQRGLGLGLSLVKATIHAHKGAVDVQSSPGQGSRFTLRLPAAPARPHDLRSPVSNLTNM